MSEEFRRGYEEGREDGGWDNEYNDPSMTEGDIAWAYHSGDSDRDRGYRAGYVDGWNGVKR